MNGERKLRRAVIKEELVALTGELLQALILNQFLYWGQRVRDFDLFIQEEKKRDPTINMELTHGWIYKSSEELAEELMVDVSARTLRRRLEELVESGLLDRRRNPKHKWDQCWQYRPNLRFIQQELQKLGYALEGYSLSRTEEPIGHGDQCIGQIDQSNGQIDQSNGQSDQALPEITVETTTETTNAAAPPAEKTEPEPPSPNPNGDFAQALRAYQGSFGPLGSSFKYEQFQMLWDEYPDLGVHEYAREEMHQAMMDDKRRVHPNLNYYAQCLATGKARASPPEKQSFDEPYNMPDMDDPDIQEWLAKRKARLEETDDDRKEVLDGRRLDARTCQTGAD